MRQIFTLIVISFLSTAILFAQKSEGGLWSSANEKYATGDFNGALADYKDIESLGYTSDALFYNIGNCYFKINDIAHSILYYERALRLNPSGKDIKYNLALAKEYTLDKIEEVPEFILTTWMRDINYTFSSDVWSYISVIFFIVAAILLLIFRYGPTPATRKLSFFLAMFLILFGGMFSLFAWNQRNAYHKDNAAVVMLPVSSVRNSPDGSGAPLFILHEGTKVELIESLGNWQRIELSDGRQGWIFGNDIEII